MKTLLFGVIAAVLGLAGLAIWFYDFLIILKGGVPAMLLLGGALAAYLGFDEIKDTWREKKETDDCTATDENGSKYKEEIDEIKKDIQTLKEEKASDSTDSADSKS